MAILLALLSAVAYGVSDFVGGLVSRRASAWTVAVVGNSASTLCVAVLALFVAGAPAPADVGWAVVAGIGSGAGTGFLYRGFSSGRMSVVAPVSAVGAALVPVAVGALGGERVSGLVWLGIVAGLFFGKQIGIMSAIVIARRMGIAHLPADASWRQLYGVALLCGIGFTMSLFIGLLAFSDAGYESMVKLAVLAGSLLSALAGAAVLIQRKRAA